MAKYRIVEDAFGCYPQVLVKVSFMRHRWKRISPHYSGGGFGLYDDLIYPSSIPECSEIIKRYKEWLSYKSKNIKVIKEID